MHPEIVNLRYSDQFWEQLLALRAGWSPTWVTGMSHRDYFLMLVRMTPSRRQQLADIGHQDIIGRYLFYGQRFFALKLLPPTIERIGDGAFMHCTELALTKLPDQLEAIGIDAFQGCTSLALQKLPDTLISIGVDAFRGCTSLALQKLPDTLLWIGTTTFANCSSLALELANTALPPSVLVIGDHAFRGCGFPADCKFVVDVRRLNANAF
jgi:hypothetical protein